MAMGVSGGFGKGKSHTKSPSNKNKHRGPKHGHGNKGKGGGNAYGSNNINLTINQARKLYANQLAEGVSLQDAMMNNKAETVSYWDLIDDTNTQNTTQSVANLLSTTTNNNEMALNQTQVNKLYNDLLGRDAVFGTGSDFDADYWLGKSEADVTSGIQGSSEFQNRAALVASGITDEATLDKMVLPGGFKTEHHSDFATGGTNASGNPDVLHFNKDNNWMGGVTNAGGNYVGELNSIMQSLGITSNNSGTNVGDTGGSMITDGSDTVTGGGGNDTVGGGDGNDNSHWLDDYADMDAFKEALGLNQSSGGIDDFMKFMMFMSMMRPNGGMFGGGGYGGSQYGYGGLNPGGVVSSYNPLENITSAIEAFKTLPGIGTGTINTGTNAGFTSN